MGARTPVRLLAICALFNLAIAARAGTIIKLDLGGVGPDISMNAGGQLSTVDDGDAATTGDQDTRVQFSDFLGGMPDITTPTASFTLSGLTVAGPAQQLGSLVIQSFAGGQFSLYDPANNLLLSGSLTTSALTGVIGPPGTASLFTTGLASASAGSLAPLILPGSLSLSMSMSNVNGGAGFTVSDGILQPFEADASLQVAAVPEPSALALLALDSLGLLALRRLRISSHPWRRPCI